MDVSLNNPNLLASHESEQNQELSLIQAVLQKDRKATAEFVSLHADAIYAYIRSRLAPRFDFVEDLVQEVFLAAWGNLSKFRGASSLRNWLLGIARHKVEDYYRLRLRDPEGFEGDDESDITLPSQDPTIDTLIDRDRLQNKVWRILQSLPESYRLILLWRYWEKKSSSSIAAEIGRTEKAVERLLARARDQFRQRWNHEQRES